MGLLKKYITEEGKKGVQDFKYQGGSVSILYQYFWSPLCDWIVLKWIPSWVAPNLITLAAFIFVMIAHLCVMFCSFDFQQEIPSWAAFLMFVATLTYQILDNCDGKQARATGTSSPLGMLFDHGCDSVVTWMLGMSVANCFNLADMRILYWTVMILSLIPFYAAQWSQYHIGSLKLGRINAIDEGLVLVWGIFLATSIFGQKIWKVKLLFNMEIGTLAIISVAFMGLFQFLQFAAYTFLECRKKGKRFRKTLLHQGCVVLLVITHYVVYQYTDMATNPLLITPYFYGLFLSWSKVTIQIQVSHITKDIYNQWRVSFLMICFAYILAALFGSKEHLPYVVYGTLIFSFICYAHIVYEVTSTIANVLKIKVFKIKPKVPEQKKVE